MSFFSTPSFGGYFAGAFGSGFFNATLRLMPLHTLRPPLFITKVLVFSASLLPLAWLCWLVWHE
ncbi:MAG: hypothetical protein WBD29_00435, partial [Candidatus Competibacter sp.]